MKPANLIADEIKARIKMPELIERYGFEIQRGNRIPCPFHGGKNANLGIKEDYCHCFKCGYNADVIKFVQDYFSLGFVESVEKINDDFALGLSLNENRDRRSQIDAARQSFMMRQQQKKKEECHEKLMTEWLDAHGELLRLDRQKREYRPKSGDQNLHPLYVEAISKMEEAKYRFKCAEEELMLYEQQN